MPQPRSRGALVAAARMYYFEDKSQAQIASALGVSRSSVSRMLSEARERGIVEIRLNPEGPEGRVADLEAVLEKRWPQVEAVVVRRPARREAPDVVGEAGARYLEGALGGLASLGLSWGLTIAKVVDHIVVEPIYQRLELMPLVGGMETLGTGRSGSDTLAALAARTGGKLSRLQAPAIVSSEATWQALMGERQIAQALAAAAGVEAALVGIGSMGVHASPSIVTAMSLSPDELAAFEKQGAVGDICGQFYDADGRPLGAPTRQRVISVSLQDLAKVPHVIGVAGGAEKAPGVLGALRGGWLRTLVIDEELAHAMIALD